MTKKRGRGLRRHAARSSFRKLAISAPAGVIDAVRDEVRLGHAASVSAFISDAVEEKLERDRLQEALDETWRERPMTAKERRWADRILKG